jgi:hypothetical protein
MASATVKAAVQARLQDWPGRAGCPFYDENDAAPAPKTQYLTVEYPVANEDRISIGATPALFRETGANGLAAYLLSWLPDGPHLAEAGRRSTKFLGQALIGVSGSAAAALISCLNRYAIGFETYKGDPYPQAAEGKEKFSARFGSWLWARPYLGAPVAPVFIWGLSHFTNHPQEFTTSNQLMGFTAFMAGLLAKSVLDLVRGVFKNVFKS